MCSLKESPFVKTDGFKQHVFRWGIGNKFRSVNANRFTPVHHARPKEVTIREDYFESPDSSIWYDSVNEQWEVYWYENHKLNAKPFPIKKFGVEASKLEAIKFLDHLKVTGKFITEDSAKKSSVPGVFWDERFQTWFGHDGKKEIGFSAAKHGASKARELAESVSLKSESLQLRNKLQDALNRALYKHS